jgi:hypothetical protein
MTFIFFQNTLQKHTLIYMFLKWIINQWNFINFLISFIYIYFIYL